MERDRVEKHLIDTIGRLWFEPHIRPKGADSESDLGSGQGVERMCEAEGDTSRGRDRDHVDDD